MDQQVNSDFYIPLADICSDKNRSSLEIGSAVL